MPSRHPKRGRLWLADGSYIRLRPDHRNRALLIRWSKKDQNRLALLMLASGLIAFKKARAATLQTALSA